MYSCYLKRLNHNHHYVHDKLCQDDKGTSANRETLFEQKGLSLKIPTSSVNIDVIVGTCEQLSSK